MYRTFKRIEAEMEIDSALSSEDYLARAIMFTGFLADNFRDLIEEGQMRQGDAPWSLFQGTPSDYSPGGL